MMEVCSVVTVVPYVLLPRRLLSRNISFMRNMILTRKCLGHHRLFTSYSGRQTGSQTPMHKFHMLCKHNAGKNMTMNCLPLNKSLIKNKTLASLYSTSSLYIGHGAQGNTAIVEVDIDLKQRLKNIDALVENVRRRNMDMDVLLLGEEYKEMAALQKGLDKTEAARTKLASLMAQIAKKKISGKNKADLIEQGKKLRETAKEKQAELWPIQEKVMLQGLGLPVDLHPNTPSGKPTVLRESGAKAEHPGKNHMDLAMENDLLSFSDVLEGTYYLKGDLVLLEQAILQYFSERLEAMDLCQLSCPDMVRTVMMEGLGGDVEDPSKVFTLSPKLSVERQRGGGAQESPLNNTYHLTGSTSPNAMMAHLLRMTLEEEDLPVSWFAVGRRYQPVAKHTGDLFSVSQSTQVGVLGVAPSWSESETQHQDLVTHLWNCYLELGLPCRLINVPSEDLGPSESLRTEVQVWVPSQGEYWPVAHLALCGDYASRRLMTTYNCKATKNTSHVYTVQGCAVNVPRAIAAILENTQNKEGQWSMPDAIKSFSMMA